MKRFRITGNLLKTLALAGLLSACNHDESVTPTQTVDVTVKDQNAKISPLLRLVDDDNGSVQYVKSGKFFGRVSRANEAPWSGYYLTYAYNDSNPSGDLWITRKLYMSSNNLFIKEERYKVVNGLCMLNEDDFGNIHEYSYTPQGYMNEIKYTKKGILSGFWKYAYNYIGSDQTYRLSKIEHKKDDKPYHTYNYTYKQIQDKYPLNIEEGNVDKYLPIFGKGSDLVLETIVDQDFETNKSITTFYTSYVTDGDGLVTSRDRIKYSALHIEKFKYSASTWQGI